MSIKQNDIIGWKCPTCGNMCHSYDIICPFCAIQLQKDDAYISLMNAVHDKVYKEGVRNEPWNN